MGRVFVQSVAALVCLAIRSGNICGILHRPRRERRTATKLYELLVEEGYALDILPYMAIGLILLAHKQIEHDERQRPRPDRPRREAPSRRNGRTYKNGRDTDLNEVRTKIVKQLASKTSGEKS